MRCHHTLPGALSVLLALAILALYHGNGLAFLFWSDGLGYLAQAQSIAGSDAYARPSGRNVGYPLLIALSLQLPQPALSLILLQLAIAASSMLLVWRTTTSAAPALAAGGGGMDAQVWRWLPPALVVASAYGGLHILAVSMLTEVLFAALALAAVVATGRFVASPSPRPVVSAIGTAAVVGLPLLVKPHWLLAAAGLGLVIAVRLAALWGPLVVASARSWCRIAVALALAFAAIAAVTWPDRHLAARANAAEAALFGPRTMFCNNMHLALRAAGASASFRLHPDPAVHAAVLAPMHAVAGRYRGGWKRLGFNGDLCSFDPDLHRAVAQALPRIEDQAAFYWGATLRTVAAVPVAFAGKVLVQMIYGITSAFEKFASHYPVELFNGVIAEAGTSLPLGFLAGVRRSGDAGPFGSRHYMNSALAGQLVNGLLGITFIMLTVGYAALVLVTLILPWRLLRRWPAARRRNFVAWLLVPLVAVAGHHLLVSITHSFDIWRYGFNVFFVNILFIVSAAWFWASELAAARANRIAAGR